MRGTCCECCEADWLHPGSGLCDACVAEYAARARQEQDERDSGLSQFEHELFDLCDFEVDGHGNIS